MTSYTLGLSGAWWFAALCILAALLASVVYYTRTMPPISGGLRVVLTALRGLGLALLAFVIFEPVLTFHRSSTEQPSLAVLLDNSASMAAQDAGGHRRESYLKALSEIHLDALSREPQYFSFDESVHRLPQFRADSLHFHGQRTDIERAIRTINDNAETDNTQALLVMSDGVFNAGANPLFVAEQGARPVYVVGIGDTSEPRDASVQSLISNEVIYLGTHVPVNARIKVSGYESTTVHVKLFDNDELVAEQLVPVIKGQQNYDLSFEFKAQHEGMRKLNVVIDAVEGELTSKNNSYSDYVSVRNDKRKVVLLAGAPSPDLSFIRSALEADHSVQLTCFIQKSGAEFYGDAPGAASLREAEIIVFVGFPIQSTPQNILQIVGSELQRSKPLLFFSSQQTDYTKLRAIEDYLPFSVQTSRPNEFSIVADVPPSEASHPLLRIKGGADDASMWNALPPVFRTETFVRVKPESEVIARMKVQNVALSDPLIVSRSFQRAKSVAVMGYGLYRWKLLGEAAELSRGSKEVPDVLAALLSNSVKWLSTSDDEKLVRIKSTRKQYATGERVEFVAQVYDAAMVPLDNAQVTVKVQAKGESREVVLSSNGSGRYGAGIDGLQEGEYTYSGTVVLNAKPYGNDAGRFSIGDVALEYQNLRMNAQALRTLAERTGGKYYSVNDVGKFVSDLKGDSRFRERSVTRTTEFSLWNLAALLAISLACFATEWVLRKRAGMI